MVMFKLLAITWAASTSGVDCQGDDCDASSFAQLQVKRAGIPIRSTEQTDQKQTTKVQAAACANWPECGQENSCNGCKKTVDTKGTHAKYLDCGPNSCSNSAFELAGASSVGPMVMCFKGNSCHDSTFTGLTHMSCDSLDFNSVSVCKDSSLAFFSTEFKAPLSLYCGHNGCEGVSVTASNNLRLTVTIDHESGSPPKSIKMSEGCLVLKCNKEDCMLSRQILQIDLQLGSKASCMAVNYGDKLPAACQDKKALSCGTDLAA
ncbi:unnamed protein product [Cladocopium goreaui]|uniref:Uncharacterized protein n=1 Tax=Cladocopium goreaui TaxID=2562237 RepID=A0A9P1DVN4_9DINO|nr:unnamed protein product [Cladocopium goreaui]